MQTDSEAVTSTAGTEGGTLPVGAGVLSSPAEGTALTSVGSFSVSSGAGSAGAGRGRILSMISMILIISTISVGAEDPSTTDVTAEDSSPVKGREEGVDVSGTKSETVQSWSP